MIYRYVYGDPINTDAVVQQINPEDNASMHYFKQKIKEDEVVFRY